MRNIFRRPGPGEQAAPTDLGLEIKAHRRLSWKFWLLMLLALLMLIAAALGGWYMWSLQPRTATENAHKQRVIIDPGDTAAVIGTKLEEAGIIRSAWAMRIYTELSGTRDRLQTGGYLISSGESVPQIVDHLVSGRTDEYNLTILAGLTLEELQQRLEKDGYEPADIQKAFNATYDHPLLASRPTGASLEGYIFPETYRVSADATLEVVLERSFDEFYRRLEQEGLLDKFKARGLTLHQALTLGSIVQMEVSDPEEQRQVAQVFYKRLKEGQPLGSDVTFFYAAKQMKVEPRVNLESPYNTRINKGLPPGPIATMELTALKAVADPAKGNYNYFVAGDDGTTYFSRTLEEHNENIRRHCTTLCE